MEWVNTDISLDCRTKLKAYRDKNKFTSYSEALENLILKGLSTKKHRTNPFWNSKNYYIALWKETNDKLIKIRDMCKLGCICNVILTLLENDKE